MEVDGRHRLAGARWVASPNANERPGGELPSLIVIHGISLPPGEFGGPHIEQLFTNALDSSAHGYFATIAHLQVSAHLLIRRNGEVVQFVTFDRRAWHAGQSSYAGRSNCNDFSIGIELEGTDIIPYTEAQYGVLNDVITALQAAYPATRGHVVGHSDIAPGRKTDPGPAFDFSRLAGLASSSPGR